MQYAILQNTQVKHALYIKQTDKKKIWNNSNNNNDDNENNRFKKYSP